MRRHANGISHYTQNLIRHFPLHATQNRYHFLVNGEYAGIVDHPNGKTITISFPSYRLKEQYAIPRLALGLKADLFVTMNYILPLALPCKKALTLFDTLHINGEGFWRGGVARRIVGAYAQYMSILSCKMADRILTCSEASKKHIALCTGVPAEKVAVFHGGVEEVFFNAPPPPPGVLAKYGIPDSYLLSIGNMRPYKNVATLVKAYASLAARRADLPDLVIGGKAKDADREFLAGLAAELGLRTRVHFPGMIEDQDLPLLYKKAAAFIFPSLAEGFGLPVLEAMASGTPVICSRVDSLPEIGGDAVLYLDTPKDDARLAELIGLLLDRPEKREALARAGVQRARDFSWDAMAGGMLRLLDSL